MRKTARCYQHRTVNVIAQLAASELITIDIIAHQLCYCIPKLRVKELILRQKRNRNGAGSIVYEPKRKKYRAYITDALGKRISKRFDSSDEADMWLSQIKLDLYNNTYIPKSNITVGEWVLEYLSTYCAPNIRAKPNSVYANGSTY